MGNITWTRHTLPKIAAEVALDDGGEVGVLEDGTPYLTGRALARFCGTAVSTIIEQSKKWREGPRTGKLAQLLIENGITGDLYVQIPDTTVPSGVRHAYTENVCLIFLRYYAMETGSEQAIKNLVRLATLTFRKFVYDAVGYKPIDWGPLHERMLLNNNVPSGYFSVFEDQQRFLMTLVKNGLPIDQRTVPDGSIGICWAKHWTKNNLAAKFGERIKHEHRFPPSFGQKEVVEAWAYPNAVLGVFRDWMEQVYLPEKLPPYLLKKAKALQLPEPQRIAMLQAFGLDKRLAS